LSSPIFTKIKDSNRKLLVSVKFSNKITEDEFKIPVIKKINFDFMHHLSKHTLDWRVIETKKNDLTTFFLTNNYFPILSFCKEGTL
jgi:hypothetical protein